MITVDGDLIVTGTITGVDANFTGDVSADTVTATTSMTSPIYYDADDNTYYGDFAGNSRVNDITLAGEMIHDGDTDTYIHFSAADTFDVVTGGTTRLTVDTTYVTSTLDGIFPQLYAARYYDSENATFYMEPADNSRVNDITLAGEIIADGDPDTYLQFHAANQFRVVTGGSERLEVSTYTLAQGSVRSPIFYDSNNTAYYGNFASTSQMNRIDINDYIRHRGDTDTYMGFDANDSWGVWTNGTRRLTSNSTAFTSGLEVRAPKFVDSDNTSYYIDPANASLSATLNGAVRIGSIANNSRWDDNTGNGGIALLSYGDDTATSNPTVAISGSYDGSYALLYLNRIDPNPNPFQNGNRYIEFRTDGASGTAAATFRGDSFGNFYMVPAASGNIGFWTSGGSEIAVGLDDGNFIVGGSSVAYTVTDNTSVIDGATAGTPRTITNNKLHVNGSVQLTNNTDAFVVGNGTSTFLSTDELAFGSGGGFYMDNTTTVKVRNDKDLSTGGDISADNGTFTGDVTADEMFAKKFIDSDDNSYFGDFASKSVMKQIEFDQTNVQAPSATDATTGARLILYPLGSGRDYAIGIESNTMWFNSDSAYKWYVDGTNYATLNNDYFTHTSDIRAPIFYDTNNTAYYANPNGDSQFNTLDIDDYVRHRGDTNTYVGFPANDQVRIATNNVERILVANTQTKIRQQTFIYGPENALVIQKQSNGSGVKIIMTDNNTGEAAYTQSGSIEFFHVDGATSTGANAGFIFRTTEDVSHFVFGSDSDGSGTTSANHAALLPQATNTGYVGNTNNRWEYGYFGTGNFSGDVTADEVFARRFVDSNDNNFYADPAGMSVFQGLTLNNTGADTILKFGPGVPSNDDAHIEWKGASNGGYLRISTSDDNGTEYIQFGDYDNTDRGGAFTEWGRINRDYLSHTSDMRAPLFYDSNNTTYFVNPASDTAARFGGRIYRQNFANDGGSGNYFLEAQDLNHWIWSTATNWGIFWATNTSASYRYTPHGSNAITFVGAGTTRASIDLDNGDAWFDGSVRAQDFELDGGNEGIGLNPAYGSGGADLVLFDGTQYFENRVINPLADNENSLTGTTSEFVRTTDGPFAGSYVLETSAYRDFYSDYIPVAPGEEIYGEISVKRISGSGGTLYYGVERYDSQKRPIATNNGTAYFVVSAANYTGTTWNTYRGHTTIPTTHTPYNGSDGGGVYYVRIRILMNYNAGGALRQFGGIMLKRRNAESNLLVDDLYALDRIDAVGIIESQASVRAPIFYDRNDTGYYIDPNSTTQSFRARGKILIGPNTSSRYLQVGGNSRDYVNNGAYASVVTTNGNLHLDAASGTSTYINYYDGDNIYFGNGANGVHSRWESNGDLYIGGGTAAADAGFKLDVNGNIQARGNVRADRFEDRADPTNRYLDPASTSELNNVNFNGKAIFKARQTDSGGSAAYVNDALRPDEYLKNVAAEFWSGNDEPVTIYFRSGVNAPSDFGYITFDPDYDNSGEQAAIVIGVENDSSDYIRLQSSVVVDSDQVGSDTTTIMEWKYQNSQVGVINTDYLFHNSDMRTPIFYDSNDTGFYGNFASTSRMNVLTVDQINMADRGDFITFYGNDNAQHSISSRNNTGGISDDLRFNSYNRIFFNLDSNNNNGTTGFYVGQHGSSTGTIAGWYFQAMTDGNSYASASFRAPIFYDRNDTNYYGDFASTSRLNILNLAGYGYVTGQTQNGQSHYQWEGGAYRNPGTYTSRFIIRQDHADPGINDSIPALVLYNHRGIDQGTTSLVFASREADGSGNAVNLAGIIAKKEGAGNANAWSSGSLNFFVKDGGTRRDALTLTTAGDVVSGFSFRAPRFYDSDDTSYYGDFASTSVMNQILLRNSTPLRFSTTSTAVFEHESNSTPVAFRMNKGGNSFNDGDSFGVLQLSRTNHNNAATGAGAGLYFNLKDSGGTLREYAGIKGRKTVAGASGGELAFMNYNRNEVARMNDDYFWHYSDVRAPIFYDSNDTNFYVNPASTSRLNLLQVTGNRIGFINTAFDAEIRVTDDNPDGTGADFIFYGDGVQYNARLITEVFHATRLMRAPILYDTNNSGYYVDPHSTTRLNRLYINARNDNYNVGSINSTNSQADWQNLTNVNGQFTVTQYNDLNNFTNAPASVYTYGAVMSWRTANHSFQLYAAHTGDLAYKTQWNNDNNSGWLTPVVYGRNAGSASGKTIYGSIFYDSDDSNYYVNPNGDLAVKVYGEISNSNYAEGNLQPGALNIGRTDTNYRWEGTSWASDVRVGLLANCADYWEMAIHDSGESVESVIYYRTDTNTIDMGRNIGWGTTQIRHINSTSSPIYYDLDNTAYRVDPNGNSYIYRVHVDDYIFHRNDTNTYIRFIGNDDMQLVAGGRQMLRMDEGGDPDRLRFVTDSNWTDSNGDWNMSRDITVGRAIYAPIMYDSNDNNYYVDPNGTSRLNQLNVNAIDTSDFNNAQYWAGDIVINGDPNTYYPVTWFGGNQDIITEIEIYRGYAEQAPWDPIGSGVHRGALTCLLRTNFGGWGGSNYDIQFDDFRETYTTIVAAAAHFANNRGFCIWLRGGGSGGAIYHIRVKGRNFGPTVSYATYDPGGNGTGVSPRTDTPGVQFRNKTRFDDLFSRNIYAETFYDWNNAGFYLDPAGNTSLRTYGAWLANSGNWSGDAGSGVGKIQYHSNRWYFNAGNNSTEIARFRRGGSDLANMNNSGWMRFGSSSGPSYSVHGSDLYADGGWLRVSGNQGVYWQSHDTRIYSPNSTYIYTRSNNGWIFQNRSGQNQGYVYHDGTNFGLLNSGGSWRMRIQNTNGDIEFYGTNQYGTAARFNVYYTRDNDAYRIDGNGDSRLYALFMDYRVHIGDRTNLYNGVLQETRRPDLTIKGQYPQLNLMSSEINNSNHGPTLRFVAYDAANASSGNFKHWVIGTAGTNATALHFGYSPNQTNPHYGIGQGWSSGNNVSMFWLQNDRHVYAQNDFRGQIFRDRNDSNYYADPASLSRFNDLQLRGHYVRTYAHSGSDFTSGTLVQTSIPATATNGASFVLEATGKSYSGDPPFSFIAQGYLYSNTIINASGQHFGKPGFGTLYMFQYNGNLCFWWPRVSYWNSFAVHVRDAGGDERNLVTSISNSGLPSGRTKQVNVAMKVTAVYGQNIATGDMYATRYYDSNNAGYYGDFASTSRMNRVDFNDIRVLGGGPAYFYAPGGSIRGYIRATDTDDSHFEFATSGGEDIIFRDGGFGGSWNMIVRGNGDVLTERHHYAQIYYDRNNSGFYMNPDSTSNIVRLDADEINIDGGGRNNANDATLYVTATNNNDWGVIINKNRSSASEYGLDVRMGGSYTYGIRMLGGGTQHMLANSDYLFHHSDMRTPIFYDSNNTAYYIDPNTTGRSANFAGYVQATEITATNGGGRLYLQGNVHLDAYGGNDVYVNYYSPSRRFRVFNGTSERFRVETNGIVYAYSQMRSPIYYDNNNTAYYYNGASDNSTRMRGVSNETMAFMGLSGQTRSSKELYAARPRNTSDTNYWTGAMGWGTVDMNTVMNWGSGFIDSWSNPPNQPSGTSHWTGTQAFHYSNGSTRYGWQLVGGPIGNLRFRQQWGGSPGPWRTVPMHDVNDGSGGALYASIYYDSNDTNYYTNPASTSRHNVTEQVGRLYYSNYLVSRNNGGLMGDYNSTGTASKVIWTIGESWPIGNMYGLAYEYGSGYDHHLSLKNNGTTYHRISFASQGAFFTGNVQAGSSHRAPIFYDSNNTSYYGNFADDNRSLRLRGKVLIDGRYGRGVTGVYTSTRYQHVWSMGDAYNLEINGVNTGNLYGIAWSHPNAGGVAGNLASHGMLILENGSFRGSWGGGRLVTTSDIRGTIFYDYNNTGFYINPADGGFNMRGGSGNRVTYLTNDSGFIVRNAEGNGVNEVRVGAAWGRPGIYCNDRLEVMTDSTTGIIFVIDNAEYGRLNTDYFRHNSDIRTPIFYDNNNTGYYIDPNSKSNFYRLGVVNYNGSTSSGNATSIEVANSSGTGDSRVAAISYHCKGYYGMHQHLRHDGYFGIGGWSASTWRWYVNMTNGDMTAAGNVTAYSDRRLKEEITPLENALDRVLQLNGVKFRWKSDEEFKDIVGKPGAYDYGIIADEVEKVAPELICESAHAAPEGDTYKTVAYDKLTPLLIEAMKEQQEMINNQNDIINNQQNEINELKSMVSALIEKLS